MKTSIESTLRDILRNRRAACPARCRAYATDHTRFACDRKSHVCDLVAADGDFDRRCGPTVAHFCRHVIISKRHPGESEAAVALGIRTEYERASRERHVGGDGPSIEGERPANEADGIG